MDSIIKSFARTARSVTRSVGVDIVRYPHLATTLLDQRGQLMRHTGIDLVFDVGANIGQFGDELREHGYQGEILSFEPQMAAYQQLRQASGADPKWHAFHYAFGEVPGTTTINLSQNSHSSSLLPMMDSHLDSAPESAYVGKEEIEVRTLNDFWYEYGTKYDERTIMLKIDVQGFEKYVLAGASSFLPHVSLIQLEMSLIELYNGEMLYHEMMDYLHTLGFGTLLTLIPGHSHPETGRLLQVDGVFGR
ncbi:FkbM family methyltransferase [Hymenobacter aquaticus]|uniref:FkbM family methyltransferase n=1 Tax=Hymenobacter aquaticus TaxID=1867101 RepID=A0A4Z0Q4X8_9BACT|nr:FkbM family methyltransferase [Hymenobacter aquaticus]TGE25097.1 FkbM family methyltransferase [Hymenobacter aquaticus]